MISICRIDRNDRCSFRAMRKESETEETEIDEEMILDTPWHKIYQENRKEAAKNHQKYDFLQLELTENGMANNTKLPHYNGVMDSPYLKEVMIRSVINIGLIGLAQPNIYDRMILKTIKKYSKISTKVIGIYVTSKKVGF